MSAFQPLGPNYIVNTQGDSSSLYSLVIDDTNSIGSVWQVTNLDQSNIAFVNISLDPTDGGAIAPDGSNPGQGTTIPPYTSVYIDVNVAGAATGPVYVSAVGFGTADVVLVPGTAV